MSFFATFVLVFIVIVRPQEIWPSLEALRLLDVFTGLAALGVVIDFALGKQRRAYSPQLPFLLAFVLVSYAASAIMLGRAGISIATTKAAIVAIFMLVVMYGARSLSRLRALVMLIVVLGLFVAGVAVHQGQQQPQCVELDPENTEPGAGTPDGRACESPRDCQQGGRPESDYECERIGLFKTISVMRRVTWRGQLADPNELSVFLGAVIPLLLTLAAARKKRWITGLALLVVGLELYCVILSRSRGGQLVIGAVFGAYFFARYRWKGVLVGAVLALPVILLGGRGGADADSSSDERVDILYDGITFVMQHPIFGLGINGFAEEIRYTAHNAYVLAAAELGLPGFFAWTGLLWSSIKIPLSVVSRSMPNLHPDVRALSSALLVSFFGMAVGIFFLSFTFKQMLFLWLGMCGALYGIVQEQEPEFEVSIGILDLLGMAAFDAVILILIFGYTRFHAG